MAKPKIKPLGDRVLVQAVEEKEQIRGGIVIPDAAKEKPQQAKVIALGTGKVDEDGKRVPFDVKVGDIVLTSKYALKEPLKEFGAFLEEVSKDIKVGFKCGAYAISGKKGNPSLALDHARYA